jgi:oligosaccharide 4-alpha-D-glucosyltransferase
MRNHNIILLSIGLLVSQAALAQNADRTFERAQAHDDHLELVTSDGVYLIRPYSAQIMETSFIPRGETHDPKSHAVVMQIGALKATLRTDEQRIEYATPGLSVVVTKAPFQIAYRYKGKPLTAEKNGYARAGNMESIDFTLEPSEALYGAGARATGMNRRGNSFPLYNKPHYGYKERSTQLNYSIPMVLSSKMYAIHFDNAQIGELDFDSKQRNVLRYDTIGGRKTYQVVVGDSWNELVGNYTALTGRQPMPPRWAFGNLASRFGYHSEAEARATLDKYAAEKIPVDAIIFDLYWFGKEMKGTMGNLAFDKQAFPDPAGMIADFNNKGVKTVLITEPFILTTSAKWQEAVEHKVLATDQAGAPYTYDIYFGNTGLIDVFKPEAKTWFWNIYKDLHKLGVEGWWGDLGEPEVHPAGLMHVAGSADQVHNIYGHEWARLIAEGYQKDFPDERPFILMRAGSSGSQRFGLIPWSGDVERSWGGLHSQPEIALQMGMQGLAYMHSDLGGFAFNLLDDELYARWLQYGVFQPIFRPHGHEDVASEPVMRAARAKALARKAIELRYRMLPYNYTLAFENNQQGLPLMRPLLFQEPANPRLHGFSESYLWGNELLVTPIVQKALASKTVHFPAGSAWFDFYSGRRHAPGTRATVKLVPEHIPVFVRAGAFIPMAPLVQTTRDYTTAHVELHYYHDRSVKNGSGKLYDDDGKTAAAYEKGKYELLSFTSKLNGNQLSLGLARRTGKAYQATPRSFAVLVHNIGSKPTGVMLDGQPVTHAWDAARKLLSVQVPATTAALSVLGIRLSGSAN